MGEWEEGYAAGENASAETIEEMDAEIRRLKADGRTWNDPDDEREGYTDGRTSTRPRIVCLCGSTRFYDEFQQANYDLTMAGYIVLSVGFYPHSKAEHGHGEGVGHDSAEKIALDELHMRKIDLADEVLVICPGGYIGESTNREIEYAVSLGKPVNYRTTPSNRYDGTEYAADGRTPDDEQAKARSSATAEDYARATAKAVGVDPEKVTAFFEAQSVLKLAPKSDKGCPVAHCALDANHDGPHECPICHHEWNGASDDDA